MTRLTVKNDDGAYAVNSVSEALERLAMYENFHAEVAAQYERLTRELAAQRGAGKEKTASFREALGNKLLLSNIISMLKIHGLTDIS